MLFTAPPPFFLFFCVCSLLNKPTAPENGTHHTAAVKKSAAKKLSPPLPFFVWVVFFVPIVHMCADLLKYEVEFILCIRAIKRVKGLSLWVSGVIVLYGFSLYTALAFRIFVCVLYFLRSHKK